MNHVFFGGPLPIKRKFSHTLDFFSLVFVFLFVCGVVFLFWFCLGFLGGCFVLRFVVVVWVVLVVGWLVGFFLALVNIRLTSL